MVEQITRSMDFVMKLSRKDYHLSRSFRYEKMDNYVKYTLYHDNFAEYLKNNVPYDVNLVVRGTVIPAHKSLLVTASDYFRAMFSGDFAEADQKEVILPTLCEQGLNLVLDALYTGTLSLTNADVLRTLDTADQLQILNILECCEDFLILALDTGNCFELLHLSEKYTLPKLNVEIEQFVICNFTQVCEHSLFPCISLKALITFICNDELDCREIDIFKGVLKWCTNDPNGENLNNLNEVMKHIRFTYMESTEIVNEVLSQSIIAGSAECQDMIEDALKYVISYEENVYSRPILEASNQEKPRGKVSVVAVPPKYTEGDASHILNTPAVKQLLFLGFKDDSIDMSETTACESQVDFAVYSMNILQMGNSLFFIGAQPLDEHGCDANMLLLRFNVQSGQWMKLKDPDFPPMVVSVSILHDKYLYIFGGAAYSNKRTIPQNTFKKNSFQYSIPNNSWSQIANCPHPVSHPAACVIKNEIFLVGGGGSSVKTWHRDQVYAYNTQEKMWIEKCSLNNGRAGHRVCTLNGKIYVIGGRDPNRHDVPECEVYDPAKNQWTVLDSTPVPQPVASYAMLVHNDRITLIGGGDDHDIRHPIIQTFNTRALTWTSYNWKSDQPHLLISGSIHHLPLLRVRLSCCAKYSVNQAEGNTCSAEPTDSVHNENQSIVPKTKRKTNSYAKHCSTQ